MQKPKKRKFQARPARKLSHEEALEVLTEELELREESERLERDAERIEAEIKARAEDARNYEKWEMHARMYGKYPTGKKNPKAATEKQTAIQSVVIGKYANRLERPALNYHLHQAFGSATYIDKNVYGLSQADSDTFIEYCRKHLSTLLNSNVQAEDKTDKGVCEDFWGDI